MTDGPGRVAAAAGERVVLSGGDSDLAVLDVAGLDQVLVVGGQHYDLVCDDEGRPARDGLGRARYAWDWARDEPPGGCGIEPHRATAELIRDRGDLPKGSW